MDIALIIIIVIFLIVGYLILSSTPIPDVDCVVGPLSTCDPNTLTRIATITTPQSGNGAVCGPIIQSCAPPPNLENNVLQWQYNCADCGGLVWLGASDKPWNKYYKASCSNENGESDLTDSFGPVGNNNYNFPMLRLQSDYEDACPGNTTNLYRSNSKDGIYNKIPSEHITKAWDRPARLVDYWDINQ